MILWVQNELDLTVFKKSVLALKINQIKSRTKHKKTCTTLYTFLLSFFKGIHV